MIEPFPLRNKTECFWLLDFINECNDSDFYYTHENNRIYISDLKSLKNLLKESLYIFTKKEKGDYKGLILVWKSFGAGLKRYYVKVLTQDKKDTQIVKDLITVLIWNSTKEMFLKIKKESNLIPIFKQKSFRFFGERGSQILLNRQYKPVQQVFKQEEIE